MAASAQQILENEVRELVRRRGIDPSAEPDLVARLIDEVVGDYRDRSITAPLPPLGDVTATSRAVLDAVAGFGALQPLLGRIDIDTMREANLRASGNNADSSPESVARWLWHRIAAH